KFMISSLRRTIPNNGLPRSSVFGTSSILSRRLLPRIVKFTSLLLSITYGIIILNCCLNHFPIYFLRPLSLDTVGPHRYGYNECNILGGLTQESRAFLGYGEEAPGILLRSGPFAL